MILQITVFLALVGSSLAQGSTTNDWKKISKNPVCVRTRDDGYGRMLYNEESKMVAALKLKYVSGNVRCAAKKEYNSKWGCGDSRKYPLNIIVTDESNNVVFPLPQYIKQSGMWYYMPLVHPVNSVELVFAEFAHPLYLKQSDSLRFWYGEDLSKIGYTDNQGEVCFHVFALFV